MGSPCIRCGTATVTRRATSSAPCLHLAGGLVPVLLSGIQVEGCPACRAERPLLPGPRALGEAVARALAARPARLSGPELRFLRSRAGIPSGRFALLIGIDPAHLSRVEHGKVEALGAPADRLARAVTTLKGGRPALRRLLESVSGPGPEEPESLPLRFRWSRKGGWKATT